jgi:hypothetical protein
MGKKGHVTPTGHPTKWAVFPALPGAAQLRIFQLLCDSCPPVTPGTCWLAPVCKQWRDLACSVKGLRVYFYSDQQQQVDSFCAWLRRHAPQVVALAITSIKAKELLTALAEAAAFAAAAAGVAEVQSLPAAAAAGARLPLQRLVIAQSQVQLLHREVCQDVLRPLLAALPHLGHLHLPLMIFGRDYSQPEKSAREAAAAALDALDPLQHSTSLTSLVLEGPWGGTTDEAHQQLLSRFPATLRHLAWHWNELRDPAVLSFSHLTGLTHLRLGGSEVGTTGSVPGDAFTSLRQLRKLELWNVPVSDEDLLAHKEQLVGLQLVGTPQVLEQLTRLQSLVIHVDEPIRDLLQQAPPLQNLSVSLRPEEEGEQQQRGEEEGTAWSLQHYKGLSGLDTLGLTYWGPPHAAPLGMAALTQLKQLVLGFIIEEDPDTAAVASWAQALAGLVHLEVLSLPGEMVDSWLTGLTRLVVLDLHEIYNIGDIPAAAAHISPLLAPTTGSSSGSGRGRRRGRGRGSGRGSSSTPPGMQGAPGQVRVVCLHQEHSQNPVFSEPAPQLHAAVLAAVPVLPPNMHLFRGTWIELQECGVELWPAPVAARLKPLVLR